MPFIGRGGSSPPSDTRSRGRSIALIDRPFAFPSLTVSAPARFTPSSAAAGHAAGHVAVTVGFDREAEVWSGPVP